MIVKSQQMMRQIHLTRQGIPSHWSDKSKFPQHSPKATSRIY